MQNHYNYSFCHISNTYDFSTKYGILYRVAFVVDESFSTIANQDINDIFQLVIDKASAKADIYDLMVSKTIIHIIECFFNNTSNAIIYVCSDEDAKAKIRFEVLDRWYKKSDYKDFILKLDNIITFKLPDEELHKMYSSLMFHQNHPQREKLIEIYSQIEATLNEEK